VAFEKKYTLSSRRKSDVTCFWWETKRTSDRRPWSWPWFANNDFQPV